MWNKVTKTCSIILIMSRRLWTLCDIKLFKDWYTKTVLFWCWLDAEVLFGWQIDMDHILWSHIIWSISYGPISYGPYHMNHFHVSLPFGPYRMDHTEWSISYVPYLFVSLHFLMFYLCIATTGCLYITSQWLLLWYSESLLESQNLSDLKVASKSKRRPCRKIEE